MAADYAERLAELRLNQRRGADHQAWQQRLNLVLLVNERARMLAAVDMLD